MYKKFSDKVGIGWRAEYAAQICENVDTLGDIEFLEVIAENYFKSTPSEVDALAAFAREIPMSLHGVSLGLATQGDLAMREVERMARLCEAVQPVFWSEHLSFVRAGGAEIGHLAMPPWTMQSAEAAITNAARAASIVGQAPALENIATLIYPPCSTLAETAWTSLVVSEGQGGMLLDLHNLYTNSVNFGLDYMAMLGELPLRAVRQIHVSGGVEIPAPGRTTRLMDNHAYDVADPCYEMLEWVAATVDHALIVVIERDDGFPPFAEILDQVRRTKAALRSGRIRKLVRENEMRAVSLHCPCPEVRDVWF